MNTLKAALLLGTVLLSLPAGSTEAGLLMVAADLNVTKSLETRCNQLIPTHSKEFPAAYKEARRTLNKAGVTDAVLAEAETLPELSSKPFPAKFDKRPEEEKRLICEEQLQKLKTAAKAKREATQ